MKILDAQPKKSFDLTLSGAARGSTNAGIGALETLSSEVIAPGGTFPIVYKKIAGLRGKVDCDG